MLCFVVYSSDYVGIVVIIFIMIVNLINFVIRVDLERADLQKKIGKFCQAFFMSTTLIFRVVPEHYKCYNTIIF